MNHVACNMCYFRPLSRNTHPPPNKIGKMPALTLSLTCMWSTRWSTHQIQQIPDEATMNPIPDLNSCCTYIKKKAERTRRTEKKKNRIIRSAFAPIIEAASSPANISAQSKGLRATRTPTGTNFADPSSQPLALVSKTRSDLSRDQLVHQARVAN